MPGPLAGLRIIEVAGLGAGPYCGMMLADMGAEVVRIERMPLLPLRSALPDPLSRGRRSVALDLRKPAGVEALLRLVDGADALFEAFRPGVAERLGFGPEPCLERNPRLVYGRMTGWGQQGPLARAAGHDLNYIALSGALHSIGPKGGKPVPPLNLVGDFGGGGLLLAFGMVCALLERERSGRGQVVDAAMLDGAVSMMAMFMGFRAMGMFDEAPGASLLGGAAHFYDTYATADGKFVAVAPLEPEFYGEFLERVGLDRDRFLPHGFRFGRMDGRAGMSSRRNWRRCSRRAAATSGVRCSRARMPVSRRCLRCPRRRRTRTTRRAEPSWKSTAWCRTPRRPASAAARRESPAGRACRARTPGSCWSRSATITMPWRPWRPRA
jgi:alpha-methylacyl-CoA racemase